MNRALEFPQWPPYGGFRQRLRLGAIAYAMGRFEVPELAGKRMFWYAFPSLTLAAQETQESQIVTGPGFWAVCLLGDASAGGAPAGGGFRAQLRDAGIKDDRSDRHLFQSSGKGVNALNGFCAAQAPYLWRVPHYIPPSHPIGLRVQNRMAVQNVVQVAIFGYVNDADLTIQAAQAQQ